ncbi:MAG: hypothetical protein WAW23_04545 [Candidatus Methanoperedens sp.]
MFEGLTTFVSGITAIFGILGIFLFFKLLSAWKNIDHDILKARVFLADKFLMKNIIVIFIVGLLIALHNFFEYLGLGHPDFYYGYLAVRYPVRLIAVTELLLALLMVEWLMYQWIKITKK